MQHSNYLFPEQLDTSLKLPHGVHVVFTTRGQPVAGDAWSSFNLATHVEDDSARVAAHRQRLQQDLQLPEAPRWLNQVHGVEVMAASAWQPGVSGDGIWTDQPGQVCAVMTADCLPVIFVDQHGGRIAAVHAGWRGLAAGVLQSAMTAMQVPGEQLLALLGPAIGPQAFRVRADVVAAFGGVTNPAFLACAHDQWQADIYLLAKQILQAAGVHSIWQHPWCTYTQSAQFFSYRRDVLTGRMASLVWRDQ